jgi:hypothetical protein
MTAAQKQVAGVAIASLVLGILGLIMVGPFGSIPAVICGHIGLSRIKKNPDTLDGGGMALAGLIMGYVQIGFMVLLVPLMVAIAIPSFVRAREMSQRNACTNNMRQMDSAKEQTAMTLGLSDGAALPEEEVSKYIRMGLSGLGCPKGGTYTLHPVGAEPECSEHGTISGHQPTSN